MRRRPSHVPQGDIWIDPGGDRCCARRSLYREGNRLAASGGRFRWFLFGTLVFLLLSWIWQAFDEVGSRRSAIYAAALRRPAQIVGLDISVENGPHFLDRLEPNTAP